MKVRFAVSPGVDVWDDDTLPEFVDALELLGFDTIWLSDIPMGSQIDPIVGLAFAASRTKRLKLGANVVPIGRNPMMLAKELAQLDRLSHGRVLLSLVPGLDQPGERQALGIGDSNRGRIIDEMIPLLRQWWRGERIDRTTIRPSISTTLGSTSAGSRFVRCRCRIHWRSGSVGSAPSRSVGPGASPTAGSAPRSHRRKPVWRSRRSTDRRTRPTGSSTRSTSGSASRTRPIEPDPATVAAFRARRPSGPVEQMFPVGAAQLRDLIGRLVEHGVSKFVVRSSVHRGAWRDDLQQLADTVLDLQT